MAYLLIKTATGETSERELSRNQPLSIGRLGFNDVVLEGETSPPMHSRISWKNGLFEVSAATKEGVTVNGKTVSNSPLRTGDVIVAGNLQLTFYANHAAAKKLNAENDPSSLVSVEVEIINDEEQRVLQKKRLQESAQKEATAVAERLGLRQVHRHERSVVKSPFILSLSIGAFVLLLASLTMWFILSREAIEKAYKQAVEFHEGGQYGQAIAAYDAFLGKYSGDKLAGMAVLKRGMCVIQSLIGGATPSWETALKEVELFQKTHRSKVEYRDVKDSVDAMLERIALGASEAATRNAVADYVPIAIAARASFEKNADPANLPRDSLKRMENAIQKAEAAIVKHTTTEAAIVSMKTELAESRPIDCLATRERLVRRYQDVAARPVIAQLTQEALKAEKAKSSGEDQDRPAMNQARFNEPSGLSSVSVFRTRTEDSSRERVVLARAKDVLYALDGVTGDPLWQRVCGEELPFFPVAIRGNDRLILAFDTRFNDLLALRPHDGQIVWRQELSQGIVGQPLVIKENIYVASSKGVLSRIELATGRVTGSLQFSQPLSGALGSFGNSEYLIAAGESGVLYTASLHPLSCETVVYTGHPKGGVRAPIISAGRLVLVFCNETSDEAKIRIYRPAANGVLDEIAAETLSGHVFDSPIVRGSQLVIPATGGRLNGFQLNDEPRGRPATLIGNYRLTGGGRSPLYLNFGPDNRFWAAADGLRRFELESDQLRLDPEVAALGMVSQPLQLLGEDYYVGRKLSYSDATILSVVDREKMVSTWRAVLGAAPLAVSPNSSDGVSVANEHGIVLSFSGAQLQKGGIDSRTPIELELPKDFAGPLYSISMSDKRLAVVAPGNRVWIIGSNGQVSSSWKLTAKCTAVPTVFQQGILIPAGDRLFSFDIVTGKPLHEEYRLPGDDPSQGISYVSIARDGILVIDQQQKAVRLQPAPSGERSTWKTVASVSINRQAIFPPVLCQKAWAIATTGGQLEFRDHETLDLIAQTNGEASIMGIWQEEQSWFVYSSDQRLQRLALVDNEVKVLWTTELLGEIPVGKIVRDNESLWLGFHNGDVLRLAHNSGKIERRRSLGRTLGLGVVDIGKTLIAVAADGTLFPLSNEGAAQ